MQISNLYITNTYATKVQSTQSIEKTEPLQTKSWDNMTPAEQSQKNHQNAMRPLPMLDDRANNILNKILTDKGLNDEEIRSTKGDIFINSLIVDSNFNTHEPQANTKEDTVKNINNLIDNLMLNLKHSSFDKENKFLLNTAKELQAFYGAGYSPLNISI
jgi:hypothetical protein